MNKKPKWLPVYRIPEYDWIVAAIAVVALVVAVAAFSGCATTSDGTPIPVFSAAEIQIILEETQIAVEQYLAVVVPDPTPVQQLAITAGRIVVRLAISKLREVGRYEDAARFELQAGLVEPEVELEPLVE